MAKGRSKRKRDININSLEFQIQQYLTYCQDRNLRESTIDMYEIHLNRFMDYLRAKGHRLSILEITEDDINDFLRFLKANNNLKQTSLNSIISHLKPFFNYLHDKDVIVSNPMKRIKKGKIDKVSKIPFTPEQLKLILKMPEKQNYRGFRDFCIMLTMADTGIRIGELLNLKINNFKFNENMIVVDLTKNRDARYVGISDKTKGELKKFFDMYLCDDPIDAYFFQNHNGEKLHKRTVQEAVKKYGEEAGIKDAKVTCHNFRRFYAINYLRNGGSTAGLREILGHKSIETVEEYLYWSKTDIVEQCKMYSPLQNVNF